MVFSFHLLDTSSLRGLQLLAQRWRRRQPDGLRHAEHVSTMVLGAPLVSTARIQSRQVAMFASWESEAALDRYLTHDPAGRRWADGWHVRLDFLRRWGHVSAFDGLPIDGAAHEPTEPVVAVTLARMRLPQVPRFIRWGRPVEAQVRDDPGQTLALAGFAPFRTVSTFTVWRSAALMSYMVAGHSAGPDPHRHVTAMRERERKDFHFEFTTLRFRCRSEHGSWQGRTGIVPT